MSRPSVTLDNYREVYAYYQDHQQHLVAARLLHGTLSVAYHPQVSYADGAEEKIEGLLNVSRQLVLAANHTYWADPCVVATLPRTQTLLRPLLGTTFIPSKAPIFSNLILRRIVDGLGAVPVFRVEDLEVAGEDAHEAEQSRLLRRAGSLLLETCTVKLDGGQHMAIFPEGTRNEGDPLKVQRLHGGVGRMVCGVSQVEQPAIVPVGVHYDERSRLRLEPSVYIGEPSSEPFAKPREVMNWMRSVLQDCVDASVQLSQTRRY